MAEQGAEPAATPQAFAEQLQVATWAIAYSLILC